MHIQAAEGPDGALRRRRRLIGHRSSRGRGGQWAFTTTRVARRTDVIPLENPARDIGPFVSLDSATLGFRGEKLFWDG